MDGATSGGAQVTLEKKPPPAERPLRVSASLETTAETFPYESSVRRSTRAEQAPALTVWAAETNRTRAAAAGSTICAWLAGSSPATVAVSCGEPAVVSRKRNDTCPEAGGMDTWVSGVEQVVSAPA